MRRPRLVYIVTHPVTADAFLRGQLAFMRENGFDVTVIASPGPELDRVAEREGVTVRAVTMERPIRPMADARSLVALTVALRALRPDLVVASTPKAGLLGMLAARAVGSPLRIYHLRGLRLETESGRLRAILSATERLASACAHDVVCNSESLREAAVRGGHVPAAKVRVLGAGSSNGVDVERWTSTKERRMAGAVLARAVGIADDDEVIGYVGRFDRDKGIVDLVEAFASVHKERPRARLLLVGGGFAGDEDPAVAAAVEGAPGVISIGKSSDLAPIYARLDVLAFPSYREGFPNVPLEAACAGVPAVGYRSTGVVDAIADGETGTLVTTRDVPALAAALTTYLRDPALRARHGARAIARARRDFAPAVVWRAWADFYRERLSARSSRAGTR